MNIQKSERKHIIIIKLRSNLTMSLLSGPYPVLLNHSKQCVKAAITGLGQSLVFLIKMQKHRPQSNKIDFKLCINM